MYHGNTITIVTWASRCASPTFHFRPSWQPISTTNAYVAQRRPSWGCVYSPPVQGEEGRVTTQGGDNVEGTVLVADMLCPGRHLGLSRYPRHSNGGGGWTAESATHVSQCVPGASHVPFRESGPHNINLKGGLRTDFMSRICKNPWLGYRLYLREMGGYFIFGKRPVDSVAVLI